MCCSDLYPGNSLISLTSKGFLIVKNFKEKLVGWLVGWKERNPTPIRKRQRISNQQSFVLANTLIEDGGFKRVYMEIIQI